MQIFSQQIVLNKYFFLNPEKKNKINSADSCYRFRK